LGFSLQVATVSFSKGAITRNMYSSRYDLEAATSDVCLTVNQGVLLLGHGGMEELAAVACPQYCLDVAYVTCPSSGAEKLPARCNCCMAPRGCTLHLADGTQQTCPS
jgi:hypothetical protein